MFLKEIEKNIHIIVIALFVFLFFLTRLHQTELTINPDAVNWHYRSEQFVNALKSFNFGSTYQHYHPGVTLMWIMGPAVEILKQLSPVDRVYNMTNFLAFHFVSKYALSSVQLVLTFILFYALNLLYKRNIAFFAVLLLTFEPFFLGNSRLLHMDVLLALFLFIGLIFAYVGINFKNILYLLLGGVFLALAFLTKSIAVGAFIFVLGYLFLLFIFKSYSVKEFLKFLFTFIVIYSVTYFLMFPAMWVSPIQTLSTIFSEASRIGLRNGHEQIYFGNFTQDPGFTFYFVVLLLKISLFTVVGVLMFVYSKFKSQIKLKLNILDIIKSPLFYLSIFYIGYFTIMTISSKKLDRYMIPLFPYISLLSILGYSYFISVYKNVYSKVIVLISAIIFVALPIILLHPYQFTYTSYLFGSAQSANNVVGQKPFGVGIVELKNKLINDYGYFASFGFIDTKPIRTIYPNSRVSDIRINGISDYDVLVLAINEEMPEKVLESSTKFKLNDIFYINGLPYWRIYVKSYE